MPTSDKDFVETWKACGANPTEVSRALGIEYRAVLKRRTHLERKLGVHLPTATQIGARGRGDGGFQNDYLQRLTLDGFKGSALIFSDAHWWPGISDTPAYRALIEVAREIKPRLVVANGDILDGARVSRFPRNGWENQPRMVDELDEVRSRMAEIRAACRGAQFIRTIGNHCIRFDRWLAMNASDFEGIQGFRLSDHLPEWKECVSVFVNGHTMIKHRFNGGIHAAYNNTLRAGTNIITGHTHRLGVTAWGDYNGRRYGAETGSLAEIGGPQFSYAEDNPSPGCSGFLVATFDLAGRLLYPELCEVIDGVAYFRGQKVAGKRLRVAA